MMKSKNLIYLIAAALPLFSACSTEENAGTAAPEASNKVQLDATWDGGATRTVMAAGGSVYWTTGDNVYCNSATAPTTDATFSNQNGTTTTGDARYNKALFTVDEASSYTLLYPSTLSGVNYSGGKYTFTFPSSQAYYDNVTFSPGVNPSTAYSTTTSLKFKNACGIVKATINGINSSTFTDVKAVRFIAGGQAVSGATTVTPTTTGAAMTISDAYTEGANDYMDVTFGTAIDLYALSAATTDASPTVYWVLLAGTYTKPTIELLNSNNKIIGMVTASKDITVTRANITRLGTVEMNAFTVSDYYEWDAKSAYPTDGTTPAEGSDSYMNNTIFNTITQDPPTAAESALKTYPTQNAKFRECPTYNEITWYLAGGVYYDANKRWGTENNEKGGVWLKKKAKIIADGTTGTGTTAVTEATFTSSPSGITEVTSTTSDPTLWLTTAPDDLYTNWFFLPALGDALEGDISGAGSFGAYWSCTPYRSLRAYALKANSTTVNVALYSRNDGFGLWTVQ